MINSRRFKTNFLFFKHKTAYEMRISDWSSDVCSSDLLLEDRFFIGSPDDVAEQIIKFNKRVGMNHVVMSMHWPGLEVARSMEAMQMLAEEEIGRASCRERVCQYV